MGPGDRVWFDIVQAEESSARVGHSDVLGLTTLQGGGAKQEGVCATRAKSLPAGSSEREVSK